jgi:hypothetical protein
MSTNWLDRRRGNAPILYEKTNELLAGAVSRQ